MVNADIPAYTTIVFRILTEIDTLLNRFVFNGYNALSHYLRAPLGILATFYIVILGYSVMCGWVKLTFSNLMKSVFKLAFIYVAVTQWGFISQFFVQFIHSAVSGMGDALISASPIHIPGVGGIDGALQATLIQFTELGSKLFDTGGLSNLGGYFDGILVWVFGYVLIGFSLLELILAKVMLAVLFVFTPLMALFCLFQRFHGVFDRWLGNIVGYALLQLFVTTSLALALSLAYWWLALLEGLTALQIGNYGSLAILILGVISIGLVWKAADMAQSIGADVRAMSSTSLVAGIVGGFVGSTLGSMRHTYRGVKVGMSAASGSKSILLSGVESSRSAFKDVQKFMRRHGSK